MPEAGFPRMPFVGNSSSCIETGVFEGYSYHPRLPAPALTGVFVLHNNEIATPVTRACWRLQHGMNTHAAPCINWGGPAFENAITSISPAHTGVDNKWVLTAKSIVDMISEVVC